MGKLWLRFCCFLTDYNYSIIKQCSEASAKSVKKYGAAMIIVGFVWGLVGFSFLQRYVKFEFLHAFIGSMVFVMFAIFVERQILLAHSKKFWTILFRVAISLIMAITGSMILDQIIFKDDIERKRIETIQVEVNHILPIKAQELTNQIDLLNDNIYKKEAERTALLEEISRKPTISVPSTKRFSERDSATGRDRIVSKEVTISSIVNPKIALIEKLDEVIKSLLSSKNVKEQEKLDLQAKLETQLESKVGFLDELNVLFSILEESTIAKIAWSIFFLLFLFLELFILAGKFGDIDSDYDLIVRHQMSVRKQMLEKLNLELTNKQLPKG